MKVSEAIEIIANLRDAFPNQAFPPASAKVYAEMIADLDASAVTRAVREICQTSRFMPAISEIRERVARNTCTLPSVEAALQELDQAVRRFSPDDSRTWTYDEDWSHPLIARAVRMVGGVAQLWGSRAPGMDRREFRSAYQGLCDEQVRAVQLGISEPVKLKAIEAAS